MNPHNKSDKSFNLFEIGSVYGDMVFIKIMLLTVISDSLDDIVNVLF